MHSKKGKCQSCHPSIWREWERSFHAQAWIDPIYQQAASQIPDREATCDPCHAPEPVLTTGLGKMPKLRDTDRESGVSCLSCHLDQNGAMHGPSRGRLAKDNLPRDSRCCCGTGRLMGHQCSPSAWPRRGCCASRPTACSMSPGQNDSLTSSATTGLICATSSPMRQTQPCIRTTTSTMN